MHFSQCDVIHGPPSIWVVRVPRAIRHYFVFIVLPCYSIERRTISLIYFNVSCKYTDIGRLPIHIIVYNNNIYLFWLSDDTLIEIKYIVLVLNKQAVCV